MKKFLVNKKFKDDDDGDDSNRRALFGSRSRDKSPNPRAQAQGGNPYAQPTPAADPYTRAKINAGVAPAPGGPAGGYGDAKHPGGPVGNQQGGYAPNRYGNQGGYGADRYGGGQPGQPGARGPGGYGGLGSTDPNDADRDALFGGARDRAQTPAAGAPPPYTAGAPAGGAGGGYGQQNNDTPSSTAVYQERQLTAEEEEEEEVNATKQELRFIKQGDVSSTRNALRVAAQAEETGRNTLARLGAQSERILDTESALDVAASQGRIAEERSRELKQLNKSMFAMHVSNPFTSNARRRDRDEKLLETHRAERNTREGTRSEAFESNQRMERTFRDIEREANKTAYGQKKDISERAKYQFEADSEDEAMEDEIDNNLDLLSGAAARLNGLAKATGQELEQQNRHLDRIMGKVSTIHTYLLQYDVRLRLTGL
jgi:protein transport protein SEC9